MKLGETYIYSNGISGIIVEITPRYIVVDSNSYGWFGRVEYIIELPESDKPVEYNSQEMIGGVE